MNDTPIQKQLTNSDKLAMLQKQVLTLTQRVEALEALSPVVPAHSAQAEKYASGDAMLTFQPLYREPVQILRMNQFQPGWDGGIGDLIEYGIGLASNDESPAYFSLVEPNEAVLWVTDEWGHTLNIDLTRVGMRQLIGAALAVLKRMEGEQAHE